MRVLAGDIGGTKTLLALAEVREGAGAGPPHVELHEVRRYDSRAFPGLSEVCAAYAAEVGALPPRAGFGVAGPVVAGKSRITNLPWVLEEEALRAALGLERVAMANDFVALASGIPALEPAHLATLQEGRPDPRGTRAVLGAGTGLGEALAVPEERGGRARWRVLATEGGHASFAARDEREMAILRYLKPRFGRVSVERVLSGDGMVLLAEALAATEGLKLPAGLREAIGLDRAAAPPLVTAAADRGDPACGEVVRLFCSLYGAEAGDLALKCLPTGGLYVGGGIAPRILAHLREGAFLHAFLDKGRMRPLLETTPVRVILDPHVALRGAAALAADT